MKANPMPMRAPISESSAANDANIAVADPATVQQRVRKARTTTRKGMNAQAPVKKPYKIAKMMVPATSLIAIIQKIRMPQAPIQRMVMLMMPTSGTRRGGITLPEMLAPFRIVNLVMMLSYSRILKQRHLRYRTQPLGVSRS